MSKVHLILPVIAAALLGGCAMKRLICEGEPYPIELSPSRRINEGLQLVSISNSGRVTIRFDDGKLASARPGKQFTLRDGSPTRGYYTLRSADRSSGRVVVEGMEFAMYAQ